MRLALACLLLGLTACASDAPVTTLGPAPAPPAWVKDLPDETRNGLAVNYTQARVGDAIAPELLTSSSGNVVRSARDWERTRRPEVLQLLTDNQYGAPPRLETLRLAGVSMAYSERGVLALDGKAQRSQSTIVLSGAAQHTIDVLLYTPVDAKGPSPVVLMVNFSPSVVMVDDPAIREVEGWTSEGKRVAGKSARPIAKQDITPFLARGYGVAMVYYSQIEPDFNGGSAFGLRTVYKQVDEAGRAPDEAGSVSTWAEGLSLVRQHLASNASVDSKRIALYGISRLGKTVLWAGAADPEFAAVIAVCSGEGGGALSRRMYGETIGHVAANFPYWFAPRWNGFAADPAASPVDSHMVMAMIAPRPLLIITGETDAWSDPYGEFLAARLASPVYRLFGKTGVDAAPELDKVTGGELSYLVHTGGHGPAPADTPAILDFLDTYVR